MEYKLPSTQEDPPIGDNGVKNNNTDEAHKELIDSLNRLTLATATPLPSSPGFPPVPSYAPSRSVRATRPVPATPQQPNQSVRAVSLQSNQPVRSVSRMAGSVSVRDERRGSIVQLQKRKSAVSLRSVSQPLKASSPTPDPSRRTSSISAGSPATATSPAMHLARLVSSPAPEAPILTASSIAAEHFSKELELHRSGGVSTKTAVVVHDDCYGHRYSQLAAPKRTIESIVERPERIRACAVGISAAYVLLGSRYAEDLALKPRSRLNKPDVPFQIIRTDRKVHLSDAAVTNVHGTQWMSELKWMGDHAESRLIADGNELARKRMAEGDGLGTNGPALNAGDLYLCSESVNAFEGALGGICEGVDLVFKSGPIQRAFVCIRPPGHHCSANFPSGFCWVNNVHVGISHAATTHGLTHAAILDFDLHHGDGSQDIAYDHNSKLLNKTQRADLAGVNAAKFKEYQDAPPYTKAAIGYYSLHDVNSFPCENGERDKVMGASLCVDAHNQSIWNVHLEKWADLDGFWKLYETKYNALLIKARSFLRQRTIDLNQERQENPSAPPPKAAIFISAGFDASEWEGDGMQRHGVNVPTEFYARFTADIIRMSQEEGLGVEGRVISVLEGGYSDRALSSGVLSHLSGLSEKSAVKSEWWSPDNLSELDAIIAAPTPSKGRKKSAATYLTATKSFAAKIVAPGRDRKSTEDFDANIVAAPLPEVSWEVATGELSKLIIPDGRQTLSCRPAELNRQRREQSAQNGGLDLLIGVEKGRQLRSRKSKESTPMPTTSRPATPLPATPRRQPHKGPKTTVAATTLPAASCEASPSVGASRRKSISQTRAGTPHRAVSPLNLPPVPHISTSVGGVRGGPRIILNMPARGTRS
ncbi:Histone deacetylase HosB [Penicillium digitatum]|uniref:Histone deacetylase HosB n=3 Tax=Penicillium digitatum TaxID=36651 RepID=K9G3P6_PEND2|nr:Histone deacetylase HosB [Penicillium digitatum Pd1]EKV15974.1 Histone deacetylase HosB [Penicillium digitatum PHI26]EKV20485.1 Histone deacetylase HosB [Penicillium digitatum Pd1]QQK39915.1 Histone deacetylase HosB [Penicillium digitatum]